MCVCVCVCVRACVCTYVCMLFISILPSSPLTYSPPHSVFCAVQIENIIRSQQRVFVLCDYGSCHICEMDPEKMGHQQCEDEIKRFTTLAYRSPEMVDLYSGQKITTKSDIWVKVE